MFLILLPLQHRFHTDSNFQDLLAANISSSIHPETVMVRHLMVLGAIHLVGLWESNRQHKQAIRWWMHIFGLSIPVNRMEHAVALPQLACGILIMLSDWRSEPPGRRFIFHGK